MKLICSLIILLTHLLIFSSCKKYLDAKPDKMLVVPNTLRDIQALLDNNSTMNRFSPAAGESSADDYYLADEAWASMYYESSRRTYLWQTGIFNDHFPNDWSTTYDAVYFANIALENIADIPRQPSNAKDWDNVKGSALFFRAKAFFEAAIVWAKAYDASSASSDLGIPLRLTSDFNIPSERARVKETFECITGDLKEAIQLLPEKPLHVMRPSKGAAFGLLARVLLYMQDHTNAEAYADSALKINSILIDYNTLDPSSYYPVPRFNEEVIMNSIMLIPENLYYGYIDSNLYRSYAEDDLRKAVFFKPSTEGFPQFYGSYFESGNLFNGIATDEMYLIRAECAARNGDIKTSLDDLNFLLSKRYKAGTFTPYNTANADEALGWVLAERRKELVYRGLRWMDLKRLNQETAYAVSLKRTINGKTYELPPNDKRYALPIPDDVISLTGMEQN